jgi:pimeloyl-ACP methyl ester carboxylesterase
VKACRAQLADSTDFSQYTTGISVDDVDEVLTALGYSQANLVGASYGTRSALVFIRRHPEHVRSAVLMGAVSTNARVPLTFARDAQEALDGLFVECEKDEQCRKAFPALREEFSGVLKKLDAGPVEVEIHIPDSADSASVKLTRNGFAQTIRYMLYSPGSAALIPLYVHLAANGDVGPIAETAYSIVSGITGMMSDGFFLCVTCGEDLAWIKPDEIEAQVKGTFLGDFRIRKQLAACAEWPSPKIQPDELKPISANTPVLLITGERDPVTPSRWAKEIASYLPGSLHIVVPDGGHSMGGMKNSECLDKIIDIFIEAGSVENLDVSCVATMERPPFQLMIPAKE